MKTFLVVCVLITSFAGVAFASNSPKISQFLQQEFTTDRSEFSALVVLNEQANFGGVELLTEVKQKRQLVVARLRQVAVSSQEDLLEELKRQGIKYRAFYIHNMVAIYDSTREQIESLAIRSDVSKVIANPVTKAIPKLARVQTLQDEDTLGVGPNISATGADRVWQELGVRGQGMVVAGQDTGYEWSHPALKSKYRGWDGAAPDHNYNWHDAIHEPISGSNSNPCGYEAAAPCDDNAHGTHTMGTMIGDDGQGNQIGMAPDATWIGCRNMDAGYGRPDTYIECFEFFLAPYPIGGVAMRDGDPDQAPHVINNSWGCPESEGCYDAETLPVLANLKAAGILVVASAGNEGSGCRTIAAPPAMHSEETLSVGASNNSGNIASFSSRGPSKYDGQIGPDVVAPGVSIRSSVRGGAYQGGFWSGTSMAGPHVAGLVALVWQANPELEGQINETVDVIRRTAQPKTSSQTCGGVSGSEIPNNTYGYGVIDAFAAVTDALKIQ